MIKYYSIHQKYLNLSITVISLLVGSLFLDSNVSAAPVTGFDPGRIIDDSVFVNSSSMNPDQIQLFLNSKVPNCDTWGTQPSEYGGGTRAQWAANRGVSPPFTCLRDYYENGRSAAQIIHSMAQEYQINPQVLIVLLQKEQGLVTDTWPLPVQYRTATGYGCPDTAPCDSQYYGLTNQLRQASRMFRSILNVSPTWYTPYTLGQNFIRWNPNTSCGGSIVNIENRSTQALYNYTPYRPNQAALNAGYGIGDSCSAYGNRNFYQYFVDWFGSTKTNDTLNPHPDGTLVVDGGYVYLIEGGSKHHITNGSVFSSFSYRYEDIKPATTGDRNLPTGWSVNFIKEGTLFRSDSSGVYISVAENGQWVKKLVSYNSFLKLGYSWNQVKVFPHNEVPQVISATVLQSDTHQNGNVISLNGAVYMIDYGTLRYVSPPVFESHRWSWEDVSPGTSADQSLPVGSDMLLRNGSIIGDGANLYVVKLPSSGSEIKQPIGPWDCYANVYKYSIRDVIYMPSSSLPSTTGSLITC